MFEFNGQPITLEQINAKAQAQGVDVDKYIEFLKTKGLKDKRRIKTWGGLVDIEVDPNKEPIDNFLIDKVARFAKGGISFVNDVLKSYETGEGGFLMEQIYENPIVALAGEIAQDLRDKGVDVPEKFGWYDLTSFVTIRS